ncbi:MAG: transglutaminase family protein, partial [Hydrogenophaga sp.]|nr:transglutaminase family protein [Hydrogenophaga sp.]
PAGHFINWQQDPFANYQARLVFPEPTTEFKVTIDLVVEMAVHNPFDFFLEPRAEEFPFSYDASQLQELAPYLATAPLTEELKAYLAQVDMKKRRTIDFLVDVNQMLQRDISYTIRMEPGVQTPEETLKLKSGSCRDTGWLLVQMLRHLGLAARFVSGYLIQLTPDVKAIDGPSGPEKDFTDLHAWCEVFLPGAGWIGLDPTSGLLAGEGHIPLACTPQPSSAAPVEGAMDKCEVEFEHHMGVTRVYESPRVTKPYTEEQWAGVVALGEKVDADLEKHDVRLTMGGEPTYVATADRDAAEWNTDALGPTKRGYATELLGRLRERYGVGGFVHMGQGKWYPGEQLPRWALSIFWRADGEPCWNNPALLADERDAARYDSEDASRFTQALARQLGLSTQFITPGFEDTWYYLWRERRLPVNVDPFDAKLDDELERARLRRVFTQGLDATVGYVLPLMANDHIPLSGNGKGGEGYHRVSGTVWSTGPWFFRDERMYLVPGDSPMGYRLPLDSLPWVSAADYPYHIEQDPHTPRDPLPAGAVLKHQVSPHSIGGGFAEGGTVSLQGTDFDPAGRPAMDGQGAGRSGPGSTPTQALSSRFPQRHESAAWLTRTALVVEARDPHRANGPKAEKAGGGKNQHLYVFMPPMQRLEDYLDLLSAVEATADQLGMTIVLEGYPPPRDPRLKMLQVTPDPGVIEVNIHPSSSWPELVERTEFLYDAAFETRLCAEKFMTDGRHTGTGGGNHFVLGGATPADSPFLRRPELLGSLVAYWHNHPSLSYLFSGLFIGPTSQAPRVDEARNDQLYELEIALQEIGKNRQTHGQDMPPWLVDRTLRNILIDVTGNTHRSEFCIDKLFSPDSPTGRLGLLELRAFEMPPHARMSIAQQLLLRAMVSRFWQKPWSGKLTRWGTELHDRYLLPTFIRMDFEDVLAELAEFGYPLDMAWFEPHFEFRFPLVGEVSARGIELTLRNILIDVTGNTHRSEFCIDKLFSPDSPTGRL